MSEPEERSQPKRELTGIARAVDALFSDPGRRDVIGSTREEPLPEPLEEAPVAEGAPAEAPPGTAEPPPVADEAPPMVDDALPLADEPPPLPDETPPLPDGPPSMSGELPPSDDGWSPRPVTPPSVPLEEPSPTPLDEAVAALLDGSGSAAEVTRLADEMLEEKVVDPVARALASLVLAAGEPPDAGLLAIAERLMSPIVLGRLARRLAVRDDVEGRREYVQVVRTIGRPITVVIGDDLSGSVDPVVRDGHVAALMGLGDEILPVVRDMAGSDNRFLVRTGVEVLGAIGGPAELPLIRDALTNADARVRTQALRSLLALEDREAASLVKAMLEDPDGQVRTTAAHVASVFGFADAAGKITALLEESTVPDEIVELLDALGRLGDEGAVAIIEKHAVRTLFSKPPTEVRIAAYGALHRIGTPHAKRLVQEATSDKDPQVGAFVNGLAVRD